MSRTYQKLPFFSALLPCRGWHVPRRRQPSPVPHTSLISSSSCCVLFPQLRTRHSSRYYRLTSVTVRGGEACPPPKSICRVSFWGAYAGCLSGDRGRVYARGPGMSSVRGTMKGIRPGADEECPFGGQCRISSRGQMQDVLPEADVIDLHEIHLARQSSLQVAVGHITVPGGIKLCSPGTFLVANYLIINNGPCQVNFTKPN